MLNKLNDTQRLKKLLSQSFAVYICNIALDQDITSFYVHGGRTTVGRTNQCKSGHFTAMWFNRFNQRATKILVPLRDTFQLEYRIAWNAEAKKQIRERGETGGFCGAGWSVFIGEWQVIRWYMSHCEESIRFVFVIAFNCVVFFLLAGWNIESWGIYMELNMSIAYQHSRVFFFFFFFGISFSSFLLDRSSLSFGQVSQVGHHVLFPLSIKLVIWLVGEEQGFFGSGVISESRWTEGNISFPTEKNKKTGGSHAS